MMNLIESSRVFLVVFFNSKVIMLAIMLGCYMQGIKEENMKPWKLHWDIQLYKALEHQYQLGLEVLNESLPEIKVELVFRYESWYLH